MQTYLPVGAFVEVVVVSPTSLSIMEGDAANSIVPHFAFVSSTTFGEVSLGFSVTLLTVASALVPADTFGAVVVVVLASTLTIASALFLLILLAQLL